MTSKPQRKDDRLWGGRFEREPDKRFDAFQRSFTFDRRLLPYELAVDRAWAKALQGVGILEATEVKQIMGALDKITERSAAGAAWVETFGTDAEDVHSFVEKALVEELGALGWRLHSAAASADACPMGSGALAGCAFAIDREAIARDIGFSRITANSIDAVGDRDFALDYFFALTGIATHLSRLAEDFVLFASQEFAYVILPDEYSTGSSLMPQKKNPDAWELIRGKTGRITGALLGLLTTLKGLPTSYQRDLQEDKEALFSAHDQIADMLAVATGALANTKFNDERLRAAASNPVLLATEAADYLVHKGIPFRQAHDLVGKVLREAEKQNVPWTSLPLETLKKIAPEFEADFTSGLSVDAALAAKKIPGGTAPESVRAAISDLQDRLTKLNLKSGAKP